MYLKLGSEEGWQDVIFPYIRCYVLNPTFLDCLHFPFPPTKRGGAVPLSRPSTRLWRCQVVLNNRLLSEIYLLIKILVFEFCHNLSCLILSQFEFLKFSNFELNFVPIQVFEFCYNSSFFFFFFFSF